MQFVAKHIVSMYHSIRENGTRMARCSNIVKRPAWRGGDK
jgi:hypothetical protein